MPSRVADITLEDVRRWPPAVDVTAAARALGVSRGTLYATIAEGRCPVQVITVGHRLKVLTASLVSLLEGEGAKAQQSA